MADKSSKPTFEDWIVNGINFLQHDIWRIRLRNLPFGKSFLIRQLRIIILAFRGFDEDKLTMRASALTFYTLLSIVPVVAMLFGIAKGFGFERMLQRELVEKFPGQEAVLRQVLDFAQSLLEVTKGGVIAGIGLVLLFWSVIRVLGHIEGSLNSIWEIKEDRNWGRKFADYLTIILISPLLILMSSSVTVFITTQVTQITHQVKLLGIISPLIFFSLKLIPYVLVWVLFSVVYILMPNTKVSFRAGILAGLVAGTIYQIAQLVYIGFQVGVSRYNAIYGSFAALPLFLMWVQISWLIVLFGAEISFANQHVDTYEFEPDCLNISPGYKRLLTLGVAHLLIKEFADGKKPLTDVQISHDLAIPIRLMHQILYDLVTSGLVSETKTDEEQKFGYQPAQDINILTINYILKALDSNGTNNIPVARTDEFKELSDSLEKLREAMEISPANKLLKDI